MTEQGPVRDDVPSLDEIQRVLPQAWSRRTAHKGVYIESNPAWGQCAATAVMVRRLFGGTIMKTTVTCPSDWKGYGPETGWTFRHYYNMLPTGTTVDLTAVQFPFSSRFHVHPDEPRTRGVPFGEETLRRAILLERRVWEALGLEWAGGRPASKNTKVAPVDPRAGDVDKGQGPDKHLDMAELMSQRVV
jgi:hypothetical protein